MKYDELSTPLSHGFRQPAEWEKQKAVWLAWPWDESLWEEDLAGAQKAVAEFARAIHAGGARVNLLVPPGSMDTQAVRMQIGLSEAGLTFFEIPFGDIWLRDIGPIFLKNKNQEIATACFRFNGWGGKYVLDGDAEVAKAISQKARVSSYAASLVFEGGALDGNGAGLALTTSQCMLNANRNPNANAAAIESVFRDYLGVGKTLWLGDGLKNDHTDGHIDNIARFIGPQRILCMRARDVQDPNRDTFEVNDALLRKMTDQQGQPLEILTIPSPGQVIDHNGKLMAASYLNFLITNESVVVPLFGSANEDQILKEFEILFPDKKIFGVYAKILLTGGGTLHCISQQEPA